MSILPRGETGPEDAVQPEDKVPFTAEAPAASWSQHFVLKHPTGL